MSAARAVDTETLGSCASAADRKTLRAQDHPAEPRPYSNAKLAPPTFTCNSSITHLAVSVCSSFHPPSYLTIPWQLARCRSRSPLPMQWRAPHRSGIASRLRLDHSTFRSLKSLRYPSPSPCPSLNHPQQDLLHMLRRPRRPTRTLRAAPRNSVDRDIESRTLITSRTMI